MNLLPCANGIDSQADIEGDDVYDVSDARIDAAIRAGLREAQAAELAARRAENAARPGTWPLWELTATEQP